MRNLLAQASREAAGLNLEAHNDYVQGLLAENEKREEEKRRERARLLQTADDGRAFLEEAGLQGKTGFFMDGYPQQENVYGDDFYGSAGQPATNLERFKPVPYDTSTAKKTTHALLANTFDAAAGVTALAGDLPPWRIVDKGYELFTGKPAPSKHVSHYLADNAAVQHEKLRELAPTSAILWELVFDPLNLVPGAKLGKFGLKQLIRYYSVSAVKDTIIGIVKIAARGDLSTEEKIEAVGKGVAAGAILSLPVDLLKRIFGGSAPKAAPVNRVNKPAELSPKTRDILKKMLGHEKPARSVRPRGGNTPSGASGATGHGTHGQIWMS